MSKKEASEAEPAAVSIAEFVRSLPFDTPVAEVVALAKARGAEIQPHYVATVRSELRRKQRAEAQAETRTATKKAPPMVADDDDDDDDASRTTSAAQKIAFVRSMPDATVARVLKAATRAGIVLSRSYVYSVRATDRERPAVPQAAPAAPILETHAPPTPLRRASDALEAQFVDVVLRMGIDRAQDLLDRLRTRVQAMRPGDL